MEADENTEIEIYSGQQARDVFETQENKDQIHQLVEHLENSVDHELGVERGVQKTHKRIERLLANDTMYFGATGPDVVAMVGYEHIGKYEGRDLFELGSSATDPDFENQGINTAMKKKAYGDIKTKHPNALVMTYTNNPTLIESQREKVKKHDWIREVKVRDYATKKDGKPWPDIKVKEGRGDCVFIVDVEKYPG